MGFHSRIWLLKTTSRSQGSYNPCFLESPLSRAFQPECRILRLMWPLELLLTRSPCSVFSVLQIWVTRAPNPFGGSLLWKLLAVSSVWVSWQLLFAGGSEPSGICAGGSAEVVEMTIFVGRVIVVP